MKHAGVSSTVHGDGKRCSVILISGKRLLTGSSNKPLLHRTPPQIKSSAIAPAAWDVRRDPMRLILLSSLAACSYPASRSPLLSPSVGNVSVVLDDVEHQLQMLGCPSSRTARYLFENAHTAKSAAGLSRFLFHALVRFSVAKLFFTFSNTTADGLADNRRTSIRKASMR